MRQEIGQISSCPLFSIQLHPAANYRRKLDWMLVLKCSPTLKLDGVCAWPLNEVPELSDGGRTAHCPHSMTKQPSCATLAVVNDLYGLLMHRDVPASLSHAHI